MALVCLFLHKATVAVLTMPVHPANKFSTIALEFVNAHKTEHLLFSGTNDSPSENSCQFHPVCHRYLPFGLAHFETARRYLLACRALCLRLSTSELKPLSQQSHLNGRSLLAKCVASCFRNDGLWEKKRHILKRARFFSQLFGTQAGVCFF